MNKVSVLNHPVNTPKILHIIPELVSFLKNRDCPKSAYLLVNGTVHIFQFFRGILSQLIDSQHVMEFYLNNCKNTAIFLRGDCPREPSIYIREWMGGLNYREAWSGKEGKIISCTPDLREISNKILRFCLLSLL